ncbi:uncharacterized protein LOC120662277 [Panicum virgatum]|uniref:GCK domain-containing protein n=1 Tax=Panicum virgatum TaxID=38727 RepID=A0A8T0VAI1_PANVG|nr:uncharacterized protein LOC120662277 [Panicum virgatum]KAG2631718.1 hypothetical protein PVAP13_2NG042500 [Panicum virgatum]
MASPEPAAQPIPAQERSPPAAAGREEAPREPVPEAAAPGAAEAEEECECEFCFFMKAGGCKDAYVALEECFEAAQKEGADFDERCDEVTANLRKCMDAHAHYYLPVLLRAVRVPGEEV